MRTTLAQIMAVIHNELRLGWRRRMLAVVTLFLALALVGFLLLVRPPDTGGIMLLDDTTTPPMMTRIDPATGQEVVTPASTEILESMPPALRNQRLDVISNSLQLITFAGVIFPVLAGVTLTLMFVETLPLDQQHRVRELLNAAPLGPGVYLAGKLLGVWLGVLIALAIVAAVFLASARLILGPYDPGQVLTAWLAMTLPFSLICSGLGLLSAARASTRRTAVVIGILLIPVVLTLFTVWVIIFFGDFLVYLTAGAPSTQLAFNQLFVNAVNGIGPITWASVLLVPALWLLQTVWARAKA